MKSMSDAISTIIIASVIILVSLIVFYLALYNLQDSIAYSEYGYVKSILISLAENVPNLVNGGSYGASLPQKMVGVGYAHIGRNITITVINNSQTLVEYSDNAMAIEAVIRRAVITGERTIYGYYDRLIINDTALLPCITEYYSGGATYIRIETARVYVRVYVYIINNVKHYVVNLLYLQMTPILVSTHPNKLVASAQEDILSRKFYNIEPQETTINFAGDINKTITLLSLIPDWQPGNIVDLSIVIKKLTVVLT